MEINLCGDDIVIKNFGTESCPLFDVYYVIIELLKYKCIRS